MKYRINDDVNRSASNHHTNHATEAAKKAREISATSGRATVHSDVLDRTGFPVAIFEKGKRVYAAKNCPASLA